MGWLHKKFIRPLLFRQDSETAHNKAVNSLARVSRSRFALGLVKTLYGAPELPARGAATAFKPGTNFETSRLFSPCFRNASSVRRTQESGSSATRQRKRKTR